MLKDEKTEPRRKQVKPRRCKSCGKEFIPRTTLQKVCGYRCMMKVVKTKRTVRLTKAKESVKDYKKLAWKEISKYVRYTNSVKDKDGKVRCYTCDKPINPQEANTGHFKHNKLDDDLRNLKIQCVRCNKHLSGNLSEYRKNLVRDYGEEWVEQLEKDAEQVKPLKQWEHKEIYERYKELNKKEG